MTVSFEVSLRPLRDPGEPAFLWSGLEAAAEAGWFQSWGWVGTWLAMLPAKARPHLLRVAQAGRTVGLALLVEERGALGRRARLNGPGGEVERILFPEDCGPLIARPWRAEVLAAMQAFLHRQAPEWAEIGLCGVPEGDLPALAAGPYHPFLRFRRPTHRLDLEALRRDGLDLLDRLGPCTRKKLARSLRLFERAGPLRLEPAQGPVEALAMLQGLTRLSLARHDAKGVASALAHPLFQAFHARLIRERFATGEIELLRLCAGPRPLGYLYQFRHQGVVHSYQCGFDYGFGANTQPGHVADLLAIRRAQAEGMQAYDLLSGHARYKDHLVGRGPDLVWLALHRSRLGRIAHSASRLISRTLRPHPRPQGAMPPAKRRML
jgi:CelD/BcsL family acetyltransferase involved in cellulose biosynthesis